MHATEVYTSRVVPMQCVLCIGIGFRTRRAAYIDPDGCHVINFEVVLLLQVELQLLNAFVCLHRMGFTVARMTISKVSLLRSHCAKFFLPGCDTC